MLQYLIYENKVKGCLWRFHSASGTNLDLCNSLFMSWDHYLPFMTLVLKAESNNKMIQVDLEMGIDVGSCFT